ncbi:hypothetical protein D3C85_1386560 [compost metagenome]
MDLFLAVVSLPAEVAQHFAVFAVPIEDVVAVQGSLVGRQLRNQHRVGDHRAQVDGNGRAELRQLSAYCENFLLGCERGQRCCACRFETCITLRFGKVQRQYEPVNRLGCPTHGEFPLVACA